MPSTFKMMLRPLYWMYLDSPAGSLRQRSKSIEAEKAWRESGAPVPPPDAIKQKIVAAYGAEFQTAILIETGTFLGGMISAMRPRFKKLISIELSPVLSARAKLRFQRYPQIEILEGDSGTLLPTTLKNISQACLFWLDGHYSGGFTAKANIETPIVAELLTIFDHPVKNHVMLIDDARLFNGTQDYPTVEEVRELVQKHRPDYDCYVRNDVIRIHSKRESFRLDI